MNNRRPFFDLELLTETLLEKESELNTIISDHKESTHNELRRHLVTNYKKIYHEYSCLRNEYLKQVRYNK